MACGCDETCNCVIQPGDGIEMSGAGSPGSPLIISATGGGAAITVTDTDSVDLTLAVGNLSAAVRRDPEATNLLASSAAGLDVSREAVQDAVGAGMGSGLEYDDTGNQFSVDLSADPGNVLKIASSDDGLFAPASPLRLAQGAVVFTWDDGWDSHDDVAIMHAARNQKATFYITSNLLGTAQHLPAAALPGMAALGHEIGCHNADHVDMTTLTPVTRGVQWDSALVIAGIVGGGYQVRSYAYPFGTHNLTTDQEGLLRFDRLATVGLAQGYIGGSIGASTLPWLYESDSDFEGFRHGRFPWSQTTHLQFMALLRDYVAKRPVVLTAYAHQIGNPDTPTLIQVTEAMDFCAANGIPCITSREAFGAPKVVNAGFESGLDGWVTILAGAAAVGTTVDTVADAPSAGLSGTNSLRIISPNTALPADSVKVLQTVPVKGNRAYTMSARLRHDVGAAGTGRFSVRINEYDRNGVSIAGRSVRGAIGSGTVWTQSLATPAVDVASYTLAGKTHPDTRYVEVGLYLQELTGTFYADHVYFGPTSEGLLG